MILCQKTTAAHAISGMRLRMKHEKTVCLASQRKKSDDPAEGHDDMYFRDNAKILFAQMANRVVLYGKIWVNTNIFLMQTLRKLYARMFVLNRREFKTANPNLV